MRKITVEIITRSLLAIVAALRAEYDLPFQKQKITIILDDGKLEVIDHHGDNDDGIIKE